MLDAIFIIASAFIGRSPMYTKDKKNFVIFRISTYDQEKLQRIADRNNISISILCRNIICSYLSKEKENNANK